ncbi:MAG: lipoprotein-releasing ABC transporter permease subunit, partial [Steroidobacteraceae bacterium]
ELRTRILSVTSDATIMGLHGTISDWQPVQKHVEREPGVRVAVPYVEEQSMLTHGQHITGASVRGILPEEERRATGLAQRLTSGSLEELQPGQYRVILGDALAQTLHVQVGDSVVLIAPEGVATPTGVMPRMRRFRVTGLFHSGMYEYDRGLALVSLTDAARLYGLAPDTVTGMRLSLADPWAAPKVVRRVAFDLGGPGYYVSDWTETHATLFQSIESTKSIMFVMLSMIVAVAAFNIVATLVMIVKEKQTDIAILRTFGAGPRNVLTIFAIQGVIIGLAGTLLGAALGALVAHNLEALVGGLERLLHTQFLDPRVYYMSDLPAYVEGFDVLRVCGVAFVLCALATVYPAWRAGRTAPAQALRHE